MVKFGLIGDCFREIAVGLRRDLLLNCRLLKLSTRIQCSNEALNFVFILEQPQLDLQNFQTFQKSTQPSNNWIRSKTKATNDSHSPRCENLSQFCGYSQLKPFFSL
jgi:hypothetical protein